MLIPHPESEMKMNIMVLGAELIETLSSKKHVGSFVLLESLMIDFLKVDARRTPDLFLYCLSFLYSIGIIDYKGYKIKLAHQLQTA